MKPSFRTTIIIAIFIISTVCLAFSPGSSYGSLDDRQHRGVIEVSLAFFERLKEDISFNMLRYSRITIEGNYRLTSQQLLLSTGLINEPWIWEFSVPTLYRRLSDLPWVDSVDVNVSILPVQLRIRIREVEPWLIAEYEKHSWLVSQSGRLIQTLDTVIDSDIVLELSELPRLIGLDAQPGPENPLSAPNARFLYAIKLLNIVQSSGGLPFSVDRFGLEPDGSLLCKPRDSSRFPEVLLSAESREEMQVVLSRVRAVIEDLERHKEFPDRLDARFDRQIVVN